jgi:hypothetical protein
LLGSLPSRLSTLSSFSFPSTSIGRERCKGTGLDDERIARRSWVSWSCKAKGGGTRRSVDVHPRCSSAPTSGMESTVIPARVTIPVTLWRSTKGNFFLLLDLWSTAHVIFVLLLYVHPTTPIFPSLTIPFRRLACPITWTCLRTCAPLSLSARQISQEHKQICPVRSGPIWSSRRVVSARSFIRRRPEMEPGRATCDQKPVAPCGEAD